MRSIAIIGIALALAFKIKYSEGPAKTISTSLDNSAGAAAMGFFTGKNSILRPNISSNVVLKDPKSRCKFSIPEISVTANFKFFGVVIGNCSELLLVEFIPVVQPAVNSSEYQSKFRRFIGLNVITNV
jgi:hypothetical protein